jgi:diguanylate cyclase (GGDEF)-like protein
MIESGAALTPTMQETIFAELARVGTESALAPGSLLWKEGDPGDSVAYLVEGVFEVVNKAAEEQEVVIRTMEAGTLVGELSSDGGNRSATVRCRSACRIVKVPVAAFRDLLRERLDIELERARETEDQLAVVLFDIDHFKNFNDKNGHEEGNVVLQTLAKLMKQVGRRGDILARYGGEEFVSLLYGAGREEAFRFAEAVRKAIEGHAFRGGEKQPGGRVTVSAGVAVFPDDTPDAQALIEAADRNLYRAKEAGRNRVVSDRA